VSEDLLGLMHDLIEIEIAQDRHVRAATAYYNFGQRLGALGRHELALAAYRAAAEHNAGYLEQDYYNRELGGLHHLLRDHAAAASAYRRALQHGGDPAQLAPLLADSLLLSGRYRESIKALEGWDGTESPSAALGAVVGVVADLVIRTTGLTEQTWHEPLPDKDVLRAVPLASPDFLTDLDALDHRYWLAAAEVLPDEDALPWELCLPISPTTRGSGQWQR
jgi:tetratricopeptide (TPR) repeat protein